MSDPRPLRFALVGCGAISTQHLEALAAVPGVEAVAVASASEAKARATGERWGVDWTTDVDALLARDDVDAVAITTPSGLHARQALEAIRAGKHVLVEKPIALSVGDAEALIDAAAGSGLTLGTVSQRRFEPIVRAARDAVAAGALGKLSMLIAEGFYFRPQAYYDSAPWRGTIALDGGVLMNQAIHTIDLLRWFGGPVERVAANVATIGHVMEAEDTASVSLRFRSGALGSIVATTCAKTERPVELRIQGEAGHIRLVGEEAAEWDVPGVERPVARPEDRSEGVPGATKTWGTSAVGYVRQYTDFAAAVRDGRRPWVSGEDGRDAVELVTAAYASSRTGSAVSLPGGTE